MQKTNFSSHTQYLFGLLFSSGDVKKAHTDQTYSTNFFTLPEKERLTNHYFSYKFLANQRFSTSVMLLHFLKEVF